MKKQLINIMDLMEVIKNIIRWGYEIVDPFEENEEKLELYLTKLFYYGLLSKNVENDGIDYDFPPDFKYDKEIEKHAALNFPKFGYYVSITEIEEIYKPKFTTGDAIWDLTSIIMSLLDIVWDYENTSDNNTLISLSIGVKSVFGFLIIRLLNYMSEKRFKS